MASVVDGEGGGVNYYGVLLLKYSWPALLNPPSVSNVNHAHASRSLAVNLLLQTEFPPWLTYPHSPRQVRGVFGLVWAAMLALCAYVVYSRFCKRKVKKPFGAER